jgi:hypothetical protein
MLCDHDGSVCLVFYHSIAELKFLP